jgi:hypothetical protein
MHGSMKKFVTTHGHAWARCLGLTKKFVTTVTPGGRAAQRCGGLVRIRLSYCWNIPSGTLQGAGGAPETLHLLTHTGREPEHDSHETRLGLCESPSR